MSLALAPISLKAANAFVDEVHRHHQAAAGHKFSIAVRDQDGTLRGVAIAGRPKAQALDDGTRLEVVRLATDGADNACSMLYSAVARAAVAMGYKKHNVFTYILESESGSSLRAAGWVEDEGYFGGGTWDREKRPREDKHPLERKKRFRAAPLPVELREAA